MATSSPSSVSDASQSPTAVPVQKKILQDVLDCIVHLKTAFFESHQPITDDSVVLQRFCAKFEHLVQFGMKEKSSLLGRKKDYWDYFCECLASAKGSNDGIKYVKSLIENKTSLGRGRAFIRFCLVHQRLADSLQQCVSHSKTVDWFQPSSVLLNDLDCPRLVNSLYDLNSMHFDLSPRGYDLDTAWPSFSNHKPGPSGSWNVPLSRRSSITSMDTVSQISMSVDSADVDRLAKDLEVAQNAKSELIGRIDALQLEKEQVSQSAWATHGEMQALQQQLRQLQSQNASLQEKYKEIDISHMKLKLEKEHAERLLRDEIKILNEKFKEEETKRVSQLQSEEDIWKKEVREEGERRKRETDRLQKELDLRVSEAEMEKERAAKKDQDLRSLIADFDVTSAGEDFIDSLVRLTQHMKVLQQEISTSVAEKTDVEARHKEEQSQKEQRLLHLESQLMELKQALRESQGIQAGLSSKVASSELKLKSEQDISGSLRRKESLMEASWKQQEMELKKMQEEVANAINKSCELEKLNNDLVKNRDEVCCKLDEVVKYNVELKYEVEKRNEEIILLKSNKQENDRMISELSQIIEINSAQVKDKESELQRYKELFEVKKEEVMVLKESSEGQATDLEKLLQKKDQALVEAAEELEAVRKELDVTKNENISLAKKLSTLEEQIINLESQNRKTEEVVVRLESEREEMIQEAQTKDEFVKNAESEVEKLKNELISLKENLASGVSLVENLRAEQTEKEIETERIRAEVKVLQVENENLKREVDSEKSRIMGLLRDSEKVKKSEGEEQGRAENLTVEIEKLRKEKEDEIVSLEGKIKNLTTDISDKNMNIVALHSEVESLKVMLTNEKLSVENKESEFQKLTFQKSESDLKFKNVIARLETEAEEIKTISENETASYSERITNLESRLSDNKRDLEVRCCEYDKLIEGLNGELSHLAKASSDDSDVVNKLTSEVASLTKERDNLVTQMDAALEETGQLKSQLAETSEKLSSTHTQLEIVSAEKESHASDLISMSEELIKVQREKAAFAPEVRSMKTSLKAAEDEVQEKLSQKRKVEHQFEELKVRLDKVVAENVDLGIQLEGYQSQTEFSRKVLEESIVEAKGTVEHLKMDLMDLQEKFESAVKDREDLKERLAKMTEEKKELSNQIDSLREKHDSIDESEIFKLREEMNEEKQKHLSVVESLNEEISALQFQLSAEQMVNLDASQTTESKSETTIELMRRVSDMEVINEQLERELESLRRAKDVDSSQAKNNILQAQEMKKLLNTKQEEYDALKNQLSQNVSKLTEETSKREKIESDHKLLRRSYVKDVEARDLEINSLKSDNEQIKKKLVQLIKDKDTLWHKTDELVSEQKRIMGDRWQDNERVTHCPQCKMEFSMFLRKHHCRVCGKIFCWSCSDYWVESSHSSKKIRSCSPCFHHNNSLGTALLSTSMIHPESDDDDEAADNEEAARRERSHENSRISSSDGVVSSTPTLANEERGHQSVDPALSPKTPPAFDGPSCDDDAALDEAPKREGSSGGEETSDDSMFQILDQETIMKSISSYNDPIPASAIPSNMTSSMLLQADDLATGEVNQQNEVWIKPGKSFILPINIDLHNTVLVWEFSSQTKDIVFSVNYRASLTTAFSEADEIIAPCKCDSHKQTVRGELTAKQAGIYTLVFDNSYSKATSKKIHYRLQYKK